MVTDLSKRCNFCEGNVYVLVDVKHVGDKPINDRRQACEIWY
jgi:hypothetical protein